MTNEELMPCEWRCLNCGEITARNLGPYRCDGCGSTQFENMSISDSRPTPSDDKELVEQVAAAISNAAWANMKAQGFSGGWDHDELGREIARAAIAAMLLSSREVALDSLPTNFELSWCEVDGDPSECAWHVHSVNGGRNDREWTVVAIGETPSEAIRAALSKDGGRDG